MVLFTYYSEGVVVIAYKRLGLTIDVLFIVSACSTTGSTDVAALKQENMVLKEQNSKLETELNELKNGADQLLKDAQSFSKNKEIVKLKQVHDTIVQKHPTAPEVAQIKKLVTDLEALVNKEKEAEAKRLTTATSKMSEKYDEVEEITWYTDQTTSKFTNSNSFHLYFGQKKDEKPLLRFVIRYTGKDWLFIDNYTFKVDDKNVEVTQAMEKLTETTKQLYGSGTMFVQQKIRTNLYKP